MRYKGFNCWYNDLQHKWLAQWGYSIVHTARTLGAVKTKITKAETNNQSGTR